MDSAPLSGPVAARKVVTALFCDVAGSTALGELLDAEVLQSVLSRYFGLAAAVIERHGGTVEKFIGDAVMAVFGVPLLHEDDAVRACRAAHELLAELPLLNDELERDFGTRLELRVGVNSGEVAAVADQLLATGDAVNVAARLEQAAEPGQILIGAATLALARDAITVEALEPLELKGKGRPVQAYRLIAVVPGRPRVSLGLDVPMVGRADEKERLEEAFRDAVARQACRLVTVLGTAGVGKSRLTAELLTGVDARVVTGRCLSYGEGITYWPVVEVVKQLGDVGEQLTARNPQVAAALGALMREGSAATPGEIAWAVRRLFEAAATERPLVVVFDDIHWGEPTFLDLIEHIADVSHDASILILCLARPELLENSAAWRSNKPGSTTLSLEPLDPGETAELIDRLIDPSELDPALVSRIRAASAGNPLFVEEMVAMARDSEGDEVEVPPTIKALLAARIDQLDPSERAVLERGAVEGELFHRGAVEALTASPEPVVQHLVALVRKELIRPDRPTLPAEDAYRFRHLLIRDAAYDALPKAARATLHERFADWLEQHGTDLVERDEIVGYHLEKAYRYRTELGPIDTGAAALAIRAAELLTNAGRRARGRGDFQGTASLLGRAADLYAPGRLALLPDVAGALYWVGEYSRAAELLDEAAETAKACGDEVTEKVSSLLRAVVRSQTGDPSASYDRVRILADDAVEALERLSDDAGLALVLYIAASQRGFLGRAEEAALFHERALEHARRAGDFLRVRQCIEGMAQSMAWGPTPVSEVIKFVNGLPDDLQRMRTRRESALMACYLGRFAEARDAYSDVQQRTSELGNRVQEAASRDFLGIIELYAGDPVEAERALRDGYERLGELGARGNRATTATLLADALLRQGRDEEAEEVLNVADEIAQPDDCDPQVRSRGVRARILARRGRLAEAERLATEAVELAARTDFTVLHGDALLALAEVLRASGAAHESTAALEEALSLFERKENVVQAEQTRALLKDLEKQLGTERS